MFSYVRRSYNHNVGGLMMTVVISWITAHGVARNLGNSFKCSVWLGKYNLSFGDQILHPKFWVSIDDQCHHTSQLLEQILFHHNLPDLLIPCSTSKATHPSQPKRKCPLPALSWADSSDVWKGMCECDARSSMKKNPNMFDNHPNLQPRMRAILLDWLNEVRFKLSVFF